MSIANELSSDVAAAMFTGKQEHELSHKEDLSEIMLEFHRTLRRLTREARRDRRAQLTLFPFNSRAAASSH